MEEKEEVRLGEGVVFAEVEFDVEVDMLGVLWWVWEAGLRR